MILKISSNIVADFNDENNFPYKLLLGNTQVSRLHKAFANNSSANIKLSKNHLHKIRQSDGFLDRLLQLLLKTRLPVMKNIFKLLAESILIRLGLTTAASATDAPIHKKMFGSGVKILIILNEEMNDIMKINKSLEESVLLIKGVSKTIKNEKKEQKGGFIGMLLGTLSATL